MRQHVRVSEILARLQPYTDVDPIVLEEKGKIGTNVHKAIVDDCAGEFVCLSSDRAKAYFESYKMWPYANKVLIGQPGRLYCDKLMITGECDGYIHNLTEKYLIDWKTSASAHTEIWNMQAHFYWYLLKQNGYDSLADKMFWINLRHDKHTFRDSKTNAIKRVEYTPKDPVVYEFKFDEKVLARCIDEANRYWEEMSDAKCVV